ncbi:hypothetical protein TrispH2_011970, partial [Trichoplax sp. H2]
MSKILDTATEYFLETFTAFKDSTSNLTSKSLTEYFALANSSTSELSSSIISIESTPVIQNMGSSIPVTYSYASLGLNNTLDYQTSNSWTDSTASGSSKVVTSISNQ